MVRSFTWSITLVVLLAGLTAFAAPPTAPLVGTWLMVSVTDAGGTERAVPNKPTDTPRVIMTMNFRADGTYQNRIQSFHRTQESSRDVTIDGTWTLDGATLTIRPEQPTPRPVKTVNITFDGDAMHMATPDQGQVTHARFERVK